MRDLLRYCVSILEVCFGEVRFHCVLNRLELRPEGNTFGVSCRLTIVYSYKLLIFAHHMGTFSLEEESNQHVLHRRDAHD